MYMLEDIHPNTFAQIDQTVNLRHCVVEL